MPATAFAQQFGGRIPLTQVERVSQQQINEWQVGNVGLPGLTAPLQDCDRLLGEAALKFQQQTTLFLLRRRRRL